MNGIPFLIDNTMDYTLVTWIRVWGPFTSHPIRWETHINRIILRMVRPSRKSSIFQKYWLVTDLVTDEVLFGKPALCKLLKIDGLRSLAKAPLKTQRIVSHEVAATAFARLQAPSSPLSQSDHVRLSSCAGYGAHAWLKAIPSTRLFRLNNNEART